MSPAIRQRPPIFLALLTDCTQSLPLDLLQAVSGDHSKEVMLNGQLMDRLFRPVKFSQWHCAETSWTTPTTAVGRCSGLE